MLFRDVEKGPSPPGPTAAGTAPAPAPAPAPVPVRARLGRHLRQDIRRQRADLVLLTCSYIAGLCDSGAFNAWSCFVSMQTGNTIFLGLGAAGLPASKPYGWLHSLVAIAAFCLGCVVFARSRRVRPRSRATLAASFVVQAVCLTVAAIVVRTGVVPDSAYTTDADSASSSSASAAFRPLLPIALLAFQGGGQVWTGDVLGFREIPTTVLTSIYFGLAADPRFWQPANGPRNRRLAAVVASLLGAISAGWLARSRAGGIPAIFFVAAGLKYAIALAWLAWPAERPAPPPPPPPPRVADDATEISESTEAAEKPPNRS